MRNLIRRFKLYVSMVLYGNRHNRDFAREHYAFFQRLRGDVEAATGRPLEELRVLDVGCGKMMWLTLLLRSAGAEVTGIDTEWTEPDRRLGKYWGIFRSNGLERACRTLAWDLLYARPYYSELARVCPFDLRFDHIDARRMSATDLEFENDTFDLVVSHEVFEHIPDVDSVVRELRRTLRDDGITYIYTHNFTSISGGHHIAWKYPDTEPSDEVPPWDHLRERRFPEIPSWINGWREEQYRQAFGREFEILDWIHTETEAEGLLTREIRDELRQYSETELLTKGFITVARPFGTTTP